VIHEGNHGSCKNPYGGRVNPSRIDFSAWITDPECIDSSKATGLQLFALTQISHAAADYLFFGLGRNGYTLIKWFEAFEFFWRTRSTDPSTWQDTPEVKRIKIGPKGEKIVVYEQAEDETLRLQCFDKYYELSELDKYIRMDAFLEHLLKIRRKLIYDSREQVEEYLKYYRRNQQIEIAGQLSFVSEDINIEFLETLIWPNSPEQVEELILPYVYKSIGEKLSSKKYSKPVVSKDPIIAEGQSSFYFTED
jgi:hypothetical protein